MALIGYARVSTAEQDLDLQVGALKDAGCKKIFQEKISGAKKARPQLDEMLKYIREGDVVVVYKLDRLARSMSQLISLVEQFKENDIGFKTLTGMEIDTTTPSGTLVFHIFAAMAEFERGLIRERSQAGMEKARAEGKHMGRPPLAPGIIEDIRRRFLAGESWRKIGQEVGVSPATISRYLDQLEEGDPEVASKRKAKPANGRRKQMA